MKLSTIVVLSVLVLLAAIVFIKWRGRSGKDDGDWPFYLKRPLSTPEQILYHRMVTALPGHIVLAQVQVSRVLGVKKGFRFHEWNNRINRMSYDFVVCAKDSSVLAVIELDDKSHDDAARTETDRKKDRATAAAGVSLVRWQASSLPSVEAIKDLVAGQHSSVRGRIEPT